MSIGFVGIGTMGSAIAANLLRAGTPLVVWNRASEKCTPLLARGATRAESIDALCAACPTIFIMVEMALAELGKRGVVELDNERRAAMVSNLLVVLCGERGTQPVVNTGSLYV